MICVAFGAPPPQTVWLISALYLATAVGQPVVGRLIDVFGPRRLFLPATALVGLSGLIGAVAPNLAVLIVARVVLGFGTCAGYPAAMRPHPRRKRPHRQAQPRRHSHHPRDLDTDHRRHGITTLVLAGISTSGVVLSTVREAADRDYRILVLDDATFDPDPQTHAFLTGTLIPRTTTVLSVEDLNGLVTAR